MAGSRFVPGFATTSPPAGEMVGEYSVARELVSRDRLVRLGGLKKTDQAQAYQLAWTVRKNGRLVFCHPDRETALEWARSGGAGEAAGDS